MSWIEGTTTQEDDHASFCQSEGQVTVDSTSWQRAQGAPVSAARTEVWRNLAYGLRIKVAKPLSAGLFCCAIDPILPHLGRLRAELPRPFGGLGGVSE